MLNTQNNVCHVLSGQEVLAIVSQRATCKQQTAPEMRREEKKIIQGILEIILQMTAQRRA